MFLFNSFFNDFKNSIYKNRGRKFEPEEKILFIIFSVFTGIYILQSILFLFIKVLSTSKIYLASMLIIIVFGGVDYYFLAQKVKKNTSKYINQHKEIITDAIVQLLKNPKYNFYSNKKVDWLIDCCNEKKNNNNFSKFIYSLKSISNIVLPIITLFIGAALGNLDTETMIYLFVIVLLIIVICIVIYLFINPIFSFILFPDKECIDYLVDELKYIKTEL